MAARERSGNSPRRATACNLPLLFCHELHKLRVPLATLHPGNQVSDCSKQHSSYSTESPKPTILAGWLSRQEDNIPWPRAVSWRHCSKERKPGSHLPFAVDALYSTASVAPRYLPMVQVRQTKRPKESPGECASDIGRGNGSRVVEPIANELSSFPTA